MLLTFSWATSDVLDAPAAWSVAFHLDFPVNAAEPVPEEVRLALAFALAMNTAAPVPVADTVPWMVSGVGPPALSQADQPDGRPVGEKSAVNVLVGAPVNADCATAA